MTPNPRQPVPGATTRRRRALLTDAHPPLSPHPASQARSSTDLDASGVTYLPRRFKTDTLPTPEWFSEPHGSGTSSRPRSASVTLVWSDGERRHHRLTTRREPLVHRPQHCPRRRPALAVRRGLPLARAKCKRCVRGRCVSHGSTRTAPSSRTLPRRRRWRTSPIRRARTRAQRNCCATGSGSTAPRSPWARMLRADGRASLGCWDEVIEALAPCTAPRSARTTRSTTTTCSRSPPSTKATSRPCASSSARRKSAPDRVTSGRSPRRSYQRALATTR